jgi:peptidoglycan hydrolase-like amidase
MTLPIATLLSTMLAASVRVGVFGLFHPQELEIRPTAGQVLEISSSTGTQVLEGARSLRITGPAKATGRSGADATFILSVPGKIQREYRGRLEVRARTGSLEAIVEMDREVAVASIVGAEAPDAPIEAQKAQAVVTRSFLAASRARHSGFDFCDTTHCQFLREPPPPDSAPARAATATRGLALHYQGRAFAAFYSGNCGGRTQTPQDAGWGPEPYPYFAVECPVRGVVSGHRVGYCQRGAMEMARRGSLFREILAHYFPATEIIGLDAPR